MKGPSSQQIEARFTQWWWQIGCKVPDQGEGESPEDHLSGLCREAFHAGASYVASHAGLNESIAAAERGTGE